MGRIGECGSMCGLSGYFYGRGFNLVVAVLKRDKTVDNAVDSPVRMYLDFINLFVRVIGSKIRR